MDFPLLVSVTRLRREAHAVVELVADSGRPVFVTQYGSVAMVLLTRRAYERLQRAVERDPEPQTAAAGTGMGQRADALADPLAVFGRLPAGTLFETK